LDFHDPRVNTGPDGTRFSISAGFSEHTLESWVTGYWRDGSIKWTAHAIPGSENLIDEYTVKASVVQESKQSSASARDTNSIRSSDLNVIDSDAEVKVNTGKILVSFPKNGSVLIGSIKISVEETVGEDGKLVLHSQSAVTDNASSRSGASINNYNFESIEGVSVEQ